MRNPSDDRSSDESILTGPRGPFVIGHRGAGEPHPENTLRSFQKAVEAGVGAVEFDVRLSRDGVPVVIHDDTLDRTTNGAGLVSDHDLSQLRGLDAGEGEKIASLADVLDSFPDLPMLIEVKETRASGPVLEVLRQHTAKKRVLVGSFVHAALRPFRSAGFTTTASRREIAIFWSAARIGLSPPGVAYQAFSAPEHSGRLHVLDSRFMSVARKKALPVHAWTVDSEADAMRLWSRGVCGIISNRPAELVSLLLRNESGGEG